MSLSSFLTELRNRDIRVWSDEDRLRCSAPVGVLTPELRDQLRQRKYEILEFLRAAHALSRQQRAIVPMQSRGTRIPVFAVAGHNGDVFAYRDLARCLGDDQPFFGLHPPGLDGDSEPLERISDLAAKFAKEVQAFHPRGPCIIAGYCAGGAVAFELAQQLQRAGTVVNSLVLFGCPYPTAYGFLEQFPHWWSRIAMHLKTMAALPSLEARLDYFIARLRARLQARREARLPAGTDPVSLAKFRFEQVMMAAVRHYAPRGYAGKVILILPNRQWAESRNLALEWRSVAPRIVEYYGPDSCDPDRMLIEPHVFAMAELFTRSRDECTERNVA